MIHYFESFYFVVFSVGVCHSAEVHHTVLESVENMSNTHELSALTTKHFFSSAETTENYSLCQ